MDEEAPRLLKESEALYLEGDVFPNLTPRFRICLFVSELLATS